VAAAVLYADGGNAGNRREKIKIKGVMEMRQ